MSGGRIEGRERRTGASEASKKKEGRERSEQEEEGAAAIRPSWASERELPSLVGSLEEEGAAAFRLSWARSKNNVLLLLFCGRSGQKLGLSGGDPLNPPRRGRTRAPRPSRWSACSLKSAPTPTNTPFAGT